LTEPETRRKTQDVETGAAADAIGRLDIQWPIRSFCVDLFCVLLRTLWAAKSNPKLANTGNAAIAAAVAVFCILMGNPDRFQKISFSPSGGVVAEARQTIQQVQVTLEQLQKMASALARGSLDGLAFSGVIMSGVSQQEKFYVRNYIVERLKDIGLKADDILEAQRVWIIAYCSIIEGQIQSNVTKAFPTQDLKHELLQL
jgi:hypothetical protein